MAPPLPEIPDVQVSPEERMMNPEIEALSPMESMGPGMGPGMGQPDQTSVYDDKSYVMDVAMNVINLAQKIDQQKLDKIGQLVCEEYRQDLASRSDWEKRYEISLKLASQTVEAKTFPWKGAANIKFPLLTTACVQFSARAYPALIPGKNIVNCRVTGFDEDGRKSRRADRISRHMSYQILEEMEEWEEDMDRMLIMLPITGTEFKKTYFDPSLGRNVSTHVLAKDLVVNYWAKSLETASRKTHHLWYTPNEIKERVNREVFLDVKIGEAQTNSTSIRTTSDKIQGLNPPSDDEDAPHLFLEQHRWYDLDEDGYKEPYIVTVHKDTEKVVRIATRFDEDGVTKDKSGKILSIEPVEYFTKYSFIPSLDGGFYDFGWGLLLGPINEAANTTINQLLDSGTLSNMQSGFLARGIRVRGGNNSFQLGEWKTVDSTGDDLRKGIVPLPSREPSQTLFQLLGMMVESGEKLSNLTDILMGQNPGQNQPATTTMAVIEQGLKVFTAVYKRLHRSLKKEYRKIYRLNRIFLDEKEYFNVIDPNKNQIGEILRSDYKGDPTDVQPSADPNIVSEAQKIARAEALVASLQNDSPINPLEVWKRYYEAIGVQDYESLLPKELPEPPPDPKIVQLQMEDARAKLELQMKADLEKGKLELEDKHREMELRLEGERIALDRQKLELDVERMMIDREKMLLDQDNTKFDQELSATKLHVDADSKEKDRNAKAKNESKDASGGSTVNVLDSSSSGPLQEIGSAISDMAKAVTEVANVSAETTRAVTQMSKNDAEFRTYMVGMANQMITKR